MMAGRLPHFILRFKRPAVPAPPTGRETPGDSDHAPSLDPRRASRDSSTTTDTEDEFFDTNEDIVKSPAKVSTYSGDIRRASAKNSKQGKANHDSTPDTKKFGPTSITLRTSASPASQLIGKRKRDIPAAIGGGKGNLQRGDLPPPNKTPRRQTTAYSQRQVKSEGGGLLPRKPEDDKRVLRSQDTTKKSEYEEWFELREEEFDYNLKMELLDDVPPQESIHSAPSNSLTAPMTNGDIAHEITNPKLDPPPPPAPPTSLNVPATSVASPLTDAEIERIRKLPIQTIDLEEEARNSQSRVSTRFTADPLADDDYIITHRAEERGEKRLRNIERELLAHNVQKMERDLDKLNSPEWTKAIGLSASILAKSTRKELEERRDRLIDYLGGIVGKHKMWKEEERRRKLGLPSKSPKASPSPAVRKGSEEVIEDHGEDEDDAQSSHDGESERDHRKMRRRRLSGRSGKRIISSGSFGKQANHSDTEPKPFTSFYRDPHLRDRAISNRRQSGRTQTAFGEPLPMLEEKEFLLPEEVYNEVEAFRATNGTVG